MEQAIVGGAIALLATLLTFWLSYKVFVRQKSLDNENHYFQFKLEKYETTLKCAAKCHSNLHNVLLDTLGELEQPDLNDEALDDLADEADLFIEKFRVELYTNASLIPDNIIKRLDKLYNNLFDVVENFDITEIRKGKIEELLDRLDASEDDLEAINNLMRRDLGIRSIDRRLKSRTHK